MSSSESEDENLKFISESVDASIFSDNLYGKDENVKKENCEKIELKSQRYLDVDEEKALKSDLNVSEQMQQFIYKKLSKIIDDQVEFVDKKCKKRKSKAADEEIVDNLRLLSDSEETVKFFTEPELSEKRQKVSIKRRKAADETEVSEDDKIKSSAVDTRSIESEVKTWSDKVKHPPIDYKLIKGIAYIRETPNEFTKVRNKNSWSENKIKNAKYFNKSLETLTKR